MQCWCRKNDERCTRKESDQDTIDYFGQCQSKIFLSRSFVGHFQWSIDLGVCTEFELEVFPKRMNVWLGEILDALVCNTQLYFFAKTMDEFCSSFAKISIPNTKSWSTKHVR